MPFPLVEIIAPSVAHINAAAWSGGLSKARCERWDGECSGEGYWSHVSASHSKYGLSITLGQPPDADKVGLFRSTPRTLGLFAMDLVEHGPQALLEQLVFGALVILADKMSTDFEGVEAKVQRGTAEVLSFGVSIEAAGQTGCTDLDLPCCRRDPEMHFRSCSSSCDTGY